LNKSKLVLSINISCVEQLLTKSDIVNKKFYHVPIKTSTLNFSSVLNLTAH